MRNYGFVVVLHISAGAKVVHSMRCHFPTIDVLTAMPISICRRVRVGLGGRVIFDVARGKGEFGCVPFI